MNKNVGIIIGLVVVIAIAGGVYASMNKSDDGMMDKKVDESFSMEDKAAMEKDSMAQGDDANMSKPGSYEAYSPEKLARAGSGDVILFFHASWCPSCRALNTNIENNLGAIPSNISILKTDYDTETELKKKYGVTYQHTMVQVNADGTMIKKWSGSPTLSSLVAEIN